MQACGSAVENDCDVRNRIIPHYFAGMSYSGNTGRKSNVAVGYMIVTKDANILFGL